MRIGLSERVRGAARRAEGLGWRASSRVLGSTLARLRTAGRAARNIVLAPQDLRPVDPSFWPEVASGHFGVAGFVVELHGRSPFDVPAPNAAWERELYGFSWLRHLEAADDRAAEAAARHYLGVWLSRQGALPTVARDPAVRSRRILSLIAHAPFLLEGATSPEFDRFAHALGRDVRRLSATWRGGTQGYGRLLAVTALVVARLTIEGGERLLPSTLAWLETEIARQILRDGGHISRNPAVLIELLLDWLPLKSCMEARGREPSAPLLDAIRRMLVLLRFLRLGDGGIARFNGLGVGDPAGLATLLAYDDGPVLPFQLAPSSRYARLDRGETVVLADVGPPPPLLHAATAHAGCLSIEVSAGGALLFCNAGAPSAADSGWRAVARATASHTTVCVGEISSSQLVRNARLEALLGAAPLQRPAAVTAEVVAKGADASLLASHDGYLDRLGLIHHRCVRVTARGDLAGTERLETKGAQDRLKRDVPFAAHFHLHPETTCEPQVEPGAAANAAVMLRLADGQRWLFRAAGASVAIEEAVSFARSCGPRPALQLVVRGATGGVSEFKWTAVRMSEPHAPPVPA